MVEITRLNNVIHVLIADSVVGPRSPTRLAFSRDEQLPIATAVCRRNGEEGFILEIGYSCKTKTQCDRVARPVRRCREWRGFGLCVLEVCFGVQPALQVPHSEAAGETPFCLWFTLVL